MNLPKLLVVAPAALFPLDMASKVRILNILKAAKKRFEVTFLANCERIIEKLKYHAKNNTKFTKSGTAAIGQYSRQLNLLRTSMETETNNALEFYTKARRLQRKLALADPLLDFDTILFTKRVPGSFNHMSDQYFGWWSRPGGGIYLLKNFKTDQPETVCLTGKTFTLL